MNAPDLLAELSSRGVATWLRPDGRIGYRGPRGAVTEEHLRQLRELRDEVVRELSRSVEPRLPAPAADPRERALTSAELDVWLYLRRGGDARTHLLSAVFDVRGPLDTKRLRAALAVVSSHHPALRSSVDATRAVMAVHFEVSPRLTVETVPAGAGDAFVDLAIDAFLSRPCDVTTAPLLSVLVLATGPERQVLVIAGHHLVVDDESLRIVAQEVLDCYGGRRTSTAGSPAEQQDAAGVAARRPAPEASRASVATRRDQLLRTSRPDDRLPGPADDPADAPIGPTTGAGLVVELDAAAVRQWQERRREAGVTTQVQELALLALAVRACGGPEELIVGMPDFGRESEADWGVVGYLVISLLLRCSLRGCHTVADLHAELRHEAVRASATRHQLPHREVAERALSKTSGHHVWLATYVAQALTAPEGLELEPRAGSSDRMRHDLRVAFFSTGEGAALHLGHRPTAISTAFTHRLARCLAYLHSHVPSPHAELDHVLDAARRHLEDTVPPAPAPTRGTAMDRDAHKDHHPVGPDAAHDLFLLGEVSRARRGRRTAGTGAAQPLVVVARPEPGADLPLPVAQAQVPGVELSPWLSSAADEVGELLAAHGVVLVRGFCEVESTFADAVELVSGATLLDYSNRSTPRTRVDGNVFTSTEYPADQTIPQHSEQAYSPHWPRVLGFYCAVAASEGGETPLAPTADVLEALGSACVDRFAEQGVLYERWFRPHLDLGWSEVFGTDDPDELRRVAEAEGIEVTWEGDLLRTRQRAQGVVEHPTTGRLSWFNQAHLFHPAALSAVARGELVRNYGERMPRNAFYGDGEPIPDGVIAAVRGALDSLTWSFRWQHGDLMLVDNVAMTHGRRPFTGPRRVLVAMAGVGGGDR